MLPLLQHNGSGSAAEDVHGAPAIRGGFGGQVGAARPTHGALAGGPWQPHMGRTRRGHCGLWIAEAVHGVRPSRAAQHPYKLLFGHKQRTLAVTAKCACTISGLNDSTVNIGSSLTKLRSCTIPRSLCTQSRQLSFLLQLVI